MASNVFDLTDVWNGPSTVFYAIKMNVSFSAAAAGSKILELQRDGVSQFSVDPSQGVLVGSPTGDVKGPGTINAAGYYANGQLINGTVTINGSPTAGQIARWFSPTVIEGVSASALGFQPLDGDLTSLAAASAIGTFYYRRAANDWQPVAFGANIAFDPVTGTLSSTGGGGGGGGDISGVGTPVINQFALWAGTTTIKGVDIGAGLVLSGGTSVIVDWNNVALIGVPTAPTAAPATNTTQIATTAFVKSQNYLTATDISGLAPIASPTFTGDPKAPTPATADNDTSIATTAYVKANLALVSGGATISDAPPASPSQGALWWESDTGTLFLNYNDGTSTQWIAIAGGTTQVVSTAFGPPQGRLTLQSGVSVMTTTQSGKTQLFYTPHVGTSIPIYDGTIFTMKAFGEISCLTTDTAKNPAAIGNSKINDWFVWDDAGTIRLGHGPDWTSDSARSAGTALAKINGIWVNAVGITNGPAAQRGTYVGTTRSGGSATLAHIFNVEGAAGFYGVWNAYNRVLTGGMTTHTVISWAISGTTIRAKANDNAASVAFVCGLQEDMATMVNFPGLMSNSPTDGTTLIAGIGVDSTTAFSGITLQGPSTTVQGGAFAVVREYYSFGFHTWWCLEATNGTNTVTVYSNLTGPPARASSGHTFSFMM